LFYTMLPYMDAHDFACFFFEDFLVHEKLCA